jgi:archaellum component FlaC
MSKRKPKEEKQEDDAELDVTGAAWNAAIDAAAERIKQLSGECGMHQVAGAFFIHDEVLKLKR